VLGRFLPTKAVNRDGKRNARYLRSRGTVEFGAHPGRGPQGRGSHWPDREDRKRPCRQAMDVVYTQSAG
jgi:hypothetical protein